MNLCCQRPSHTQQWKYANFDGECSACFPCSVGDGDSGFHYYMAGGDFREDRVYNGKVVEPGWEHIPPAGTTAPGK